MQFADCWLDGFVVIIIHGWTTDLAPSFAVNDVVMNPPLLGGRAVIMAIDPVVEAERSKGKVSECVLHHN